MAQDPIAPKTPYEIASELMTLANPEAMFNLLERRGTKAFCKRIAQAVSAEVVPALVQLAANIEVISAESKLNNEVNQQLFEQVSTVASHPLLVITDTEDMSDPNVLDRVLEFAITAIVELSDLLLQGSDSEIDEETQERLDRHDYTIKMLSRLRYGLNTELGDEEDEEDEEDEDSEDSEESEESDDGALHGDDDAGRAGEEARATEGVEEQAATEEELPAEPRDGDAEDDAAKE